MNDLSASDPDSQRPFSDDFVSTSPSFLSRWFLLCGFVAVLLAVYGAYKYGKLNPELSTSQEKMLSSFGIVAPSPKHLAPGYSDQHGRLLADPPADVAKLLDPDTLVVAYGEDSDLDVQPLNWSDFQKHLSQATGKKVVIQEYNNTAGDLAAITDGKIHVIALHAADTPFLVNNAGFIPVAVIGNDAGAIGNHLDLAVRHDSNVKTLADIKGHTLTDSRITSITGHRAAVAVLLLEAGLRPNVDYFINYSFGQTRSVLGLANGDYEIAALSDDKLQSLLKAGKVKPSDYRIIYESPVIPRYTIGYVYNLAPALATQISQAILDYKNEAGDTVDPSVTSTHFLPIDYKKDFEFVRKMDEVFDPRFGYKVLKQKVPTDSAPDTQPTTDAGD